MRNIFLAAVFSGFAAAISLSAVAADERTRELFRDLEIKPQGSTLIARATRAATAHREHEHYGYNDKITISENAVAACFHAADWEVRRKRRGLHARLDEVKKIKKKSDGLKVTILVTNFYRNGHTQRWVKCLVQHDEVVFLKYS